LVLQEFLMLLLDLRCLVSIRGVCLSGQILLTLDELQLLKCSKDIGG
jgi:hypothetical protein